MTAKDQAQQARSDEALDPAPVEAFLKSCEPDLEGPLTIYQFPGGASNLTYLLQFQNRELILRRPPFGQKARSAHDMDREYRVMAALKPAFPYVPRVVAHSKDPEIVGDEFYVMERIPGIIIRKDMPADLELSESEQGTLCRSFMDKLIELHKVDYASVGLGDLGQPEGYVARQIHGWSKRYRNARTEDAPEFERTMAWLAEKMPGESGASLIHNDYRFDNVVLNPDNPLQVIGVLDWEMATIGDPLMDLGNSLAYWLQADDPHEYRGMRMQPSHLPGMLTRQQLIDYYAEHTGREIGNFDFYLIYGLFRLAVIAQQIYYRYYHGQTRDQRFASFVDFAKGLEMRCERLIEASEL